MNQMNKETDKMREKEWESETIPFEQTLITDDENVFSFGNSSKHTHVRRVCEAADEEMKKNGIKWEENKN